MNVAEAVGDVWQWLIDSGDALAGLAAVGTGVIAVIALRSTALDSRERSRPTMLAELRLALESDTTLDLVVRNAGPSAAHDVSVSFLPALTEPASGGPYVIGTLIRRYAKPIPVIAPGQELRNIWWTGHVTPESGSKLVNAEPTPDEVTILIRYRGRSGRRYEDRYDLVVDTMLATTHSVSSTSLKGRLKTIDASLKKSANAQVEAARHLRSIADRSDDD